LLEHVFNLLHFCGCRHKNVTLFFGYFDLVFLLGCLRRMNFWEALRGLSLRWVQPLQQQGRRLPVANSSIARFRCARQVAGFFGEVIQHVHSFLASGVISFQAAFAFGAAVRAF